MYQLRSGDVVLDRQGGGKIIKRWGLALWGNKMKQGGVSKFDVFVTINTLLFIFMTVFVYYNRFIMYRGRDNINEFYIYAIIIYSSIHIVWYLLRKINFTTSVLVAVQVGVLMHFAGGLIHIEGVRLYSQIILGIRYDKYVHFANAVAMTLFVCSIMSTKFKSTSENRIITAMITMMVVLGLGAVVEIAEYIVTLTVKNNGVGGYDNNMQDLISNFLGTSIAVIILYAKHIDAGSAARGLSLPERLPEKIQDTKYGNK